MSPSKAGFILVGHLRLHIKQNRATAVVHFHMWLDNECPVSVRRLKRCFKRGQNFSIFPIFPRKISVELRKLGGHFKRKAVLIPNFPKKEVAPLHAAEACHTPHTLPTKPYDASLPATTTSKMSGSSSRQSTRQRVLPAKYQDNGASGAAAGLGISVSTAHLLPGIRGTENGAKNSTDGSGRSAVSATRAALQMAGGARRTAGSSERRVEGTCQPEISGLHPRE